jgi:hypothetical protein
MSAFAPIKRFSGAGCWALALKRPPRTDGNAMSDIDHMMGAPSRSAPGASPIEEPGASFNAARSPPKSDLADDEPEAPRSPATVVTDKLERSIGRRPLFRR